ncbi:MAG: hypothetical protein J2P19_28335 [Pseudonocardia sp.]|nr:hypothetical protein [Pseudonocardia sp.]
MTDLAAPRRPVRTYERDGREVYADTGRPVNERLGSHVVLWIVDDPEAWAAAIEADADAEVARWSKSKRNRELAELRRSQHYESAAQIRAEGDHRKIYGHYHDLASAESSANSLRRSHPNPGVRYATAEIDELGACPDCHQPRIFVDGQWWHHSLRYPVECTARPEPVEDEPEHVEGEWVISVGTGSMICGYCNHDVCWSIAALGYARLTGYHMLGIEKATGALVVLAEATTLSRQITVLPHHCDKIPGHLQATYGKR